MTLRKPLVNVSGTMSELSSGDTLDAAYLGQVAAISWVTIVSGTISTPLDAKSYQLTLSSDVLSGWTAALPTGGDQTANVYYCTLDIYPPSSGGPYILAIPSAWYQGGPLNTIALSAGHHPITVTLRSIGTSNIVYSAVQL